MDLKGMIIQQEICATSHEMISEKRATMPVAGADQPKYNSGMTMKPI